MRPYDISLIRTFTKVYETRSVTKASQQLFVTQPAVSYALNRLRAILSDDLFVRRGQEMVPTVTAEKIYPRLRASLEVMDEIIRGEEQFAPASSKHHFRMQMTDVGVSVLLPPIIKALAASGPHIRVEVEPLRLSTAPADLIEGKIDAFLCTPNIIHPDIRRDVLFRQDYVGICSPSHPRIGPRPSLSDFLRERHISFTGDTGHHVVDEVLIEMGHQREIVLSVPNFLVLPELMQGTDLVGFAPLIVAKKFQDSGRAAIFELPIPVPVSEVSLYSYRRQTPSPSTDWFRDLVRASLDEFRKLSF